MLSVYKLKTSKEKQIPFKINKIALQPPNFMIARQMRKNNEGLEKIITT